MSRVHALKCWPRYFGDLVVGRKRSEFRVADRDFRVGDYLRLREYDPATGLYSGRETVRRVQFLYHPHQAPGFCVMELEIGEVFLADPEEVAPRT